MRDDGSPKSRLQKVVSYEREDEADEKHEPESPLDDQNICLRH